MHQPAYQESCIAEVRSIWLSILIPIYNVAPYLEECLSSVAVQLSQDGGIEVILVDDCSTDGSRELAERLCGRFGAAFRLIRNPANQGISVTRNILIDQACGSYIWFIDSDDMISGDAIASLKTVVNAHAPDVITCDYMRRKRHLSSASGQPNHLQSCRDEALFNLFHSRKLYGCTRIMRSKLWTTDLRFPAGQCFEDVAVMPQIFLRATSFYHVREPWYFYRVRSGSITQSASDKSVFDLEKNNDRAAALHGFPEKLHAVLPDVSHMTRYAIGYFVSRELFKIGRYRMRSQRKNPQCRASNRSFNDYRSMMEKCSPMNFRELANAHLRQRRLFRWLQIRFWLAFALIDR